MKQGTYLADSKRGGYVEEYRFYPARTINKMGLRIDLSYQFSHLFSRFDQRYFDEGQFYFIFYLTRLSLDESSIKKDFNLIESTEIILSPDKKTVLSCETKRE